MCGVIDNRGREFAERLLELGRADVNVLELLQVLLRFVLLGQPRVHDGLSNTLLVARAGMHDHFFGGLVHRQQLA
jgi:hypothetical protein